MHAWPLSWSRERSMRFSNWITSSSGLRVASCCGAVHLMMEAISGTHGGTQWPSVAISGHQRPSVAISGHQWPSVAISGHQWQSVAISMQSTHLDAIHSRPIFQCE